VSINGNCERPTAYSDVSAATWGNILSQTRLNYEYLLLISHDLRSAMSDIVGGLHLLDRDELGDANLTHIERVAAASQSLTRLLDEAFSKFEGVGNVVLQETQFSLAEFLENIRSRWVGRAVSAGVAMNAEADGKLPDQVEIDMISLERILSNILGNALKFSDKGTVSFRVSTSASQDLIFQITDSGPGFSKAALDRLFEYAGRRNESTKPGTGLGLHIAKASADLLGARLEICNGQEIGATCKLTIPHDRWRIKNQTLSSNLKTELPDLTGVRVLLAEDNATNQLVASQMLKSMGAELTVCSDGKVAWDEVRANEFDVAFLDIEMPRMSGLELIREIRSMDGPKSKLPLIALTAYVMREHRDRILASGANAIVAKPIQSVAELGQAAIHEMVPKQSQQTTPKTGSESGVDLAIFDNLMASVGPDLSTELMGKLNEDIASASLGLREGKRQHDRKRLQTETHILTSVAGVIGAAQLQKLAGELNSAAHEEPPKDLDALVQSCIEQLEIVATFISEKQS
jgi:two-component system aerobic respiration control sensor histidine kinase ArcB